jgi:hypothetical protein
MGLPKGVKKKETKRSALDREISAFKLKTNKA